ncbi:MAG: DUF6265 family protein [Ignavibacteriales bacterium]
MKLITLLIFISASIFAQDEDVIKLFPGKWKVDVDYAQLFEEWKYVNKNELTGKSYSVEDGEKVIVEELCIKKIGNQWAYISVPKDQIITLFALTAYSQGMFVFENKEHDFPQRITYEFKPDGKLEAAIEGDLNGERRRKTYSFIKVYD